MMLTSTVLREMCLQERLHNFINNRKPKDLKKTRTLKNYPARSPPTAQVSEGQPDNEQQAESIE